MLTALAKAVAGLGDPKMLRIALLGAVLAALAFLIAAILAWIGIEAAVDAFAGFGAWSGLAAGLLGFAAVLILAWFTFPALAAAIVGAGFGESIAAAVEARHYPGRPAPRAIPWHETVVDALKLAALAFLGNLIALPFLLGLFPLYALLAYAIGGYLIGREYFELIAFRRLPREEARLLYRRRRGQVSLAGALIAFLATVPVVNLVAPALGIAFMLHLFESMLREGDYEQRGAAHVRQEEG